ncbi:vegetative cell wall protein gp1 [Xylariaceae sp. FL0255]|nr:vegetative cell wall protein gp1 [Xylariaceae sp. FL0255]
MSYGGHSPYSQGTPVAGDPYYYDVNSPSPTPSPHHYPFYPVKTPQRSASRSHHRNPSAGMPAGPGFGISRPTTAFSPRYKSTGEYATVPGRPQVSSRKHSFSNNKGASSKKQHHRANSGSHRYPDDHHYHEYAQQPPRRERRASFSYFRASYGDSDEDEVIEADGFVHVLRPQWKSARHRNHYDYYTVRPEHGTDYYYYPQGFPNYFDTTDKADRARAERHREERIREEELPARSATRVGHHATTHRRSSSTAMPNIQRPATVRPTAQLPKKPAAKPTVATEADARKHKIPAGYSLKNWDPSEEPIMLLGSVFDANSLGKWIYDWTVYCHTSNSPMADMAGELWLLLIQLMGKIKRCEETVPSVRSQENREMMEDFITSGERLGDKLRHLLKRCEAPMLKASKKRDTSQLGKNSGVEFVETLFGIDRELNKTERFMQSVRLWNLRFDANCEELLKRPYK